jgi:hypothetical protein
VAHNALTTIGKVLLVTGLAVALVGLALLLLGKLPGASVLGRLPGDLVFRGKNTTVYVPLATCLLVSALVSLLLYLFRR